jgi:hypothetical protein
MEITKRDLINQAHKDITRIKGKDYAPNKDEIQKWIDNNPQKVKEITKGELEEEKKKKDDRCTRIAKRKYDVWPSAYSSAAVVRCRQGKIWKGLKEEEDETLDEKWSEKYKRSIDCNNPKGFSQKAHCKGRLKEEDFLDEKCPKLKITDEMKDEMSKFNSAEQFLRSGGFSIEVLDRAAYGFSSDDIKTLMPNELNIKWKDDYENVIYEQMKSGLSKIDWAKKINLTEPIDVIFEKNKFYIDDGHHRFYAAKILKRPLNINLEIKQNPILSLSNNLSYDDFHRCAFKSFKDNNLNEKTDYSKEKKQGLHGWFARQGGSGKSKGWVDCNTCRDGKCKSCGRKEGEKRSKYPACRPTPSACKTKGKGKSWGKKS